MADNFLAGLLEQATIFNAQAAEAIQNYPVLSKAEDWRWTPLKALRSKKWRMTGADYQSMLADELAENLVEDAHEWQAFNQAPFAALNVSLLNETLVIDVPENFASTQVEALNISQRQRDMQFSRVRVRLGKDARLCLWMDVAAVANGAQVSLIEFELAENAALDAVCWASGEAASAQVMEWRVLQARGSEANVNAALHSSVLARLDVVAELQAEDAHFKFGGVQMTAGEEVADFHVQVRHLAENCTSQQVVRGVLREQAQGIFDGLIYVAYGAQKTDARQDSRYILLDKSAKSHSVPRLEIYADDVQCAHGSTVGFLDAEAVFYLQSRGIGLEEAQKMLTLGFLQEATILEDEEMTAQFNEAIISVMQGEQE
ncbi:Fe-S cluster assembly protein SufD [Suttonella ornithocola]|uniref:FeS cluster assembly protein sufD n=1 Tax=Suttonella ornithocola TaxID=279832 RepID=A0A380MW78_9GAMM|nr:Fe-S cluster assembly protein SufD [Suttonella ornithocola]SUO96306.1 FeS cluster assembly protein sufD [Suttonella ornithocola]